MYSVVLMMALSGTADVPALGHRKGGCCGETTSCGCEGGGRQHRCGHRRNRGGCCGNEASCGSCGTASCCAPVSCGCGGGAVYGPAGSYQPGPDGYRDGPRHDGPGKTPEKIKKPMPKESMLPAAATIVVTLPANATLTIDNTATQSTSATRVFSSPELQQGLEYVYTLKAEMVRGGEKVTASKSVTVRAGEETAVSIDFPVASLAKR